MMKFFVLLLLLVGCASVEERDEPTEVMNPVSVEAETEVESVKRKLLFELVVRQGDTVVSQPKIQGVEGYPMSISFNVNLEETNTDMVWTVKEDIVEMTVSVVAPDGSQDNHVFSFALGTATQFEIEHLRYSIDVTASEI